MEPIYQLFISQPMNGLSDEEILAERERIRQAAENRFDGKVELIDSFFGEEFEKNAAQASRPPIYYLGESIKKLSGADIVWFGKGWDEARGCKIEHSVAEAYEIPNIFEEYKDGTRIERCTYPTKSN